MSVTIGSLRVRASVPRRLRSRAPDAVRLARDVLPAATARRLAGRLPPQPTVCRIRRLQVRVRLSARQLDEVAVADAWAEAFCAALLTAMNQPPSSTLVVAESVEEWIALAVAGALEGRSLTAWPFDEFAHLGDGSAAGVITALAREARVEWRLVLQALAGHGAMTRLLTTLGPSGCRDVLEAIAAHESFPAVATIGDLISIGRALGDDPALHAAARDETVEAVALRLMARPPDAAANRWSPRSLRAGIAVLLWLASRPSNDAPVAIRAGDPRLRYLADAPMLLPLIRSLIEPAPAGTVDAARAALEALLPALANPAQARQPLEEVHESAMAGLMLLVPVVDRLEWPGLIRSSHVGAQYGSRALTYLLTGVGLALAGRPAATATRFDPALNVFAGSIGSSDPGALARFCRDAGAGREGLVRLLCDREPARDEFQDWDAAFTSLASRLLRQFANRLRGLSKSSDRFLIDRILAVPGTLTIGERVIRVRLRSQGLWPALHLSGADAAMDAVGWMGGRRLEFHLEGL